MQFSVNKWGWRGNHCPTSVPPSWRAEQKKRTTDSVWWIILCPAIMLIVRPRLQNARRVVYIALQNHRVPA
ncbi:MAG: hypothetical protein COX30_04965 [Candidatus Moranbacteria bacterium CG23_combo_of_CG06-09_8_20_14_all_39_10]|nr:MAG: hypothetical protein COX30_04965 [Candidatus Moranbacteria bacterium CG23_combo_of_CG06-09_8_20_14_all_39_10]